MPFRYEEKTTPKGSPLLVIHAAGHVSFEDADELLRRILPGGPNHKWLLLTLADKSVEYAPAARKHFANMKEHYRGLATVVGSPIVRAAINLMLRLNNSAPNFRIFASEADALAWLDAL
ncbi:MAG TPA: STAS/SEC14 domain-containing protein [Nannocystis sp.]